VKRLYALSFDDAAEVRALCETHAQRDVAALFRVSSTTISRVRRGLSWRSDGPADPRRANAKLTPENVAEIRFSPLSRDDLARKFRVCRRTVYRAQIGETWRTI
jgi:hypothetical protein